MFDECVAPLVDGLFQGYNATVLAYGQVGILLLPLSSSSATTTHACSPRSGSVLPSLNHLARIPCAIDAVQPRSWKSLDHQVGGLATRKSPAAQHVVWGWDGTQITCFLFFWLQLFVTRWWWGRLCLRAPRTTKCSSVSVSASWCIYSFNRSFLLLFCPHQTGSGKTYTMGTACKEGSHIGIIPRAMAALFDKIENLKTQVEFQLRVSFIEVQELFQILACEWNARSVLLMRSYMWNQLLRICFSQILKEEVRDLLDPTAATVGKAENGNGHAKLPVPGKPPVQIREASNGVITLAGSTEVHVTTQKEMAACLEQGSLSRATGSTNMNNQSRLATSS